MRVHYGTGYQEGNTPVVQRMLRVGDREIAEVSEISGDEKALITAVVLSIMPEADAAEIARCIDEELAVLIRYEEYPPLDDGDRFAEYVGGLVAKRILQDMRIREAQEFHNNKKGMVKENKIRAAAEKREQDIQQQQAQLLEIQEQLAIADLHQNRRRILEAKRRRIASNPKQPYTAMEAAIEKNSEETAAHNDRLHHPVEEHPTIDKDSKDFLRPSNRYFYHATPIGNLRSIQRSGLDPAHGSKSGFTESHDKGEEYNAHCRGKVHFSDYVSTVDIYAHSKSFSDQPSSASAVPFVVFLRFPQAYLSGKQITIDPDDPNTGLTVSARIPPELIEVMWGGRWTPIQELHFPEIEEQPPQSSGSPPPPEGE